MICILKLASLNQGEHKLKLLNHGALTNSTGTWAFCEVEPAVYVRSLDNVFPLFPLLFLCFPKPICMEPCQRVLLRDL